MTTPASSDAASGVAAMDAGARSAADRPPSLVAKTSWSAVGTAASALGAAVASILVYRILSPTDAGSVAYATWFAGVCVALFGLGLAPTVTRYVAELGGTASPGAPAVVGRWMLRLGLAVLAAASPAVAAIWAILQSSAPGARTIAAVTALFASQAAAALLLAVLAGLEDFRTLAFLNIASALLTVVAAPAGAWALGVGGAIAGTAVGALPLAVASLRFAARRSVGRPDAALAARMRTYAAASWTSTVVAVILWSRAEVFFLERSVGTASVAMFAIGASLAQMAGQAPLLLVGALVPHFTWQASTQPRAALAETYGSATRVLALAVFPLSFGLAALTPRLVPLVFGAAYADAVPAAAVLVAAAPIGVVGSAAASVVYALERSRFMTAAGVASALAACALYAAVIPSFGLLGAAWSRVAVQLAAASVGYLYLALALKVPSPIGGIARIVVAAASSAALGNALVRAIPGPAALLPAAVAMAAAYVALLRVTRAIPREEAHKLLHAAGELPPYLGAPGRFVLGLIAAAPPGR